MQLQLIPQSKSYCIEQKESKTDKNLSAHLFVENNLIHVKSYKLKVWNVYNLRSMKQAKALYDNLNVD